MEESKHDDHDETSASGIQSSSNVHPVFQHKFARISGIVVGGLGIIMALALATFDIASLWDQFNLK